MGLPFWVRLRCTRKSCGEAAPPFAPSVEPQGGRPGSYPAHAMKPGFVVNVSVPATVTLIGSLGGIGIPVDTQGVVCTLSDGPSRVQVPIGPDPGSSRSATGFPGPTVRSSPVQANGASASAAM